MNTDEHIAVNICLKSIELRIKLFGRKIMDSYKQYIPKAPLKFR